MSNDLYNRALHTNLSIQMATTCEREYVFMLQDVKLYIPCEHMPGMILMLKSVGLNTIGINRAKNTRETKMTNAILHTFKPACRRVANGYPFIFISAEDTIVNYV